jgi:hypothetical protein
MSLAGVNKQQQQQLQGLNQSMYKRCKNKIIFFYLNFVVFHFKN